MIKYLNTTQDPKIIESIVKYYLNLNKNSVIISDKLKNYLDENFQITLNEILDLLIINVRVSKVEQDIVSIYILNIPVGDSKLETILQLIEFGNRDIPQTNQISKLLNKTITQTENRLGGI